MSKPTIEMQIEQIDELIERNKRKFRRAVNAIMRLERQRKRLVVKAAVVSKAIVPMIAPAAPAQIADAPPPIATVAVAPADHPDMLAIPAGLRRPLSDTITVDAVADAIRTQQAEHKKAKARGRIAKLKAKQAGDTKRMPLTGKAALDFIKAGK